MTTETMAQTGACAGRRRESVKSVLPATTVLPPAGACHTNVSKKRALANRATGYSMISRT